jgi:hypothetical protein
MVGTSSSSISSTSSSTARTCREYKERARGKCADPAIAENGGIASKAIHDQANRVVIRAAPCKNSSAAAALHATVQTKPEMQRSVLTSR